LKEEFLAFAQTYVDTVFFLVAWSDNYKASQPPRVL
jgi:hypothetical protein